MKRNKGITLIALVVTIIVLLILAGTSITMLTGQNGILNRTAEAKEKTRLAKIDEGVKMAVMSALSKGLGTIEDEYLRDGLEEYLKGENYTLTGDRINGWTIIVGGKNYNIDGNGTVSKGNKNYSEEVEDEDIAPEDLFLYDVISDTDKTAKITGLNPIYCNGIKTTDEENGATNYEIIYNGNKIPDTLVVPYKVTIDGEEYTITEACVFAKGKKDGSDEDYGLPKVRTIIFPDTLKKVTR